ncbi:MAG: endonuclease MutS2, partial [Lachnospiraceae bacterium]|nr:endonuclease MutS2 [Lachnospiraceae bacterium]
MDKKALYTLEFDKIIRRLAERTTSEPGREFAGKVVPQTDLRKIRRNLLQSRDALGRIMRFGTISFSGVFDIRPMGKRLSLGGGLSTGELLSVAGLLVCAERAKQYEDRNRQTIHALAEASEGRPGRPGERGDSLARLFESIEVFPELSKEITRCIPAVDEIADDASPALADIRRAMARMNDRVHDKLNAMLSSASVGECLRDRMIVLRDNHYCLPVRAEFKSRVPGLLHDTSASGSTLFIEPMAVLELGNELREWKNKEAEEIERILLVLSERVAGAMEALIRDAKTLSILDFVFAKGKLAVDMNAQMPELNDKGIIHLRKARHPLLDPETVVPIDVSLGEEYTQLVVTGPNTGGKTVSLKTVGLLSLMGQAGLLIPAADRSKLAVFVDIRADIGDEQSIEQSLSTFSSHMTNIVQILNSVD